MNSDCLPPQAERFQALLDAQHVVSHELSKMHMSELIRLDMTMGQLKTLMVLASRGGMNVSSLAETLKVSKPTASILVDQLVHSGFARRTEDTEDRRRTLVTTTPAGDELVRTVRQVGYDRIIRWLEQLEPEDLAALTRGMQALAKIAEREEARQTVMTESLQ